MHSSLNWGVLSASALFFQSHKGGKIDPPEKHFCLLETTGLEQTYIFLWRKGDQDIFQGLPLGSNFQLRVALVPLKVMVQLNKGSVQATVLADDFLADKEEATIW